MKKVYNIAIAITLSGTALRKCEGILDTLDTIHNIKFIKKNQVTPHITLSVGIVEQNRLEVLKKYLSKLLKKCKRFTISTNGLGVFLKDEINIHIRWHVNQELEELKYIIENGLKNIWEENKGANTFGRWIPKTSLAFKDINYTNMAEIEYAKIVFKDTLLFVDELVMIEYEVNHPEKELQKFKID